jgi:hypothetical protein
VAHMLMTGETEREGVLLCSGRETGEEVRRGPVRCPHRIEYRAILTTRDEGEPQPPEKRPGGRRRSRGRGSRRRDVA